MADAAVSLEAAGRYLVAGAGEALLPVPAGGPLDTEERIFAISACICFCMSGGISRCWKASRLSLGEDCASDLHPADVAAMITDTRKASIMVEERKETECLERDPDRFRIIYPTPGGVIELKVRSSERTDALPGRFTSGQGGHFRRGLTAASHPTYSGPGGSRRRPDRDWWPPASSP